MQMFEEQEYDLFRAPRRFVQHHQQSKTNASHTQESPYASFPKERVEKLVPSNKESQAQAGQIVGDSPTEVAPSNAKTLSNSNVLVSATISPMILTTCDAESPKNSSGNAENLDISAELLSEKTEDQKVIESDSKTVHVPEKSENLSAPQPEMLKEPDKGKAEQDQDATSSTRPDLIMDIPKKVQIGDAIKLEPEQSSASVLPNKSNEIQKSSDFNISLSDVDQVAKDNPDKVNIVNTSSPEVVQSSDLTKESKPPTAETFRCVDKTAPKINGSQQKVKQVGTAMLSTLQ